MFKRIIQIVSGSRSGSTLLKAVLAKSPSVSSLDGEEEPYFKLCGNGYGLTSNSDSFGKMENALLFRNLVYEELTTERKWENRLALQFSGKKLAALLNNLHTMDLRTPGWWLSYNGIHGMYDGCDKSQRMPFDGNMVYEMRPFVYPKNVLERPTKVIKDTLLLKNPYNVYRPGIIEQIYPCSEIIKVVVFRNPAAIINGLYDGWCANYGFHKHLTPYGWWKFDLPPNWEEKEYAYRTTMEKCWFQFDSSYTAIMCSDDLDHHYVSYEHLVNEPEKTINSLCALLDIESPWKSDSVLPMTMNTEFPKNDRWKTRAGELLPLVRRSSEVVKFMGYKELL